MQPAGALSEAGPLMHDGRLSYASSYSVARTLGPRGMQTTTHKPRKQPNQRKQTGSKKGNGLLTATAK